MKKQKTWKGPNIKERDSLPIGDMWEWGEQDREMETE